MALARQCACPTRLYLVPPFLSARASASFDNLKHQTDSVRRPPSAFSAPFTCSFGVVIGGCSKGCVICLDAAACDQFLLSLPEVVITHCPASASPGRPAFFRFDRFGRRSSSPFCHGLSLIDKRRVFHFPIPPLKQGRIRVPPLPIPCFSCFRLPPISFCIWILLIFH